MQLNKLSPEEEKVVIEPGDQATTLRLNEKCRQVGTVETVPDEFEVRVRAAALRANTVQVLYTRSEYGAISNDVRFWTCH